jgi:hypothetical protein
MNLCFVPDGSQPDAEVQARLIRAVLAAEEAATGDDAMRSREEIAAALGVSEEDLCPCLIEEGVVGLKQSLLLTFEDQARWARDSWPEYDHEVDFLDLMDPTQLSEIAPERVTIVR